MYGIETVFAVNGYGRAVDQNILPVKRRISLPNHGVAGEDDVGIHVEERCGESVGRGIAVDFILILVHQVAIQVRDVRSHDGRVLTANAQRRKGDSDAISRECHNAGWNNGVIRSTDLDVADRNRREVNCLVERQIKMIEHIVADVLRRIVNNARPRAVEHHSRFEPFHSQDRPLRKPCRATIAVM